MRNNNPQNTCFHCHLTIPPHTNFIVETSEGEKLPMCCPGCKAVTETILKLNLSQFYQYREQSIAGATPVDPSELSDFTQYDNPDIYNEYITTSSENAQNISISLYIEGISCSACVWLIEQRIRQLTGVESCTVNLSNHQALISWNKTTLKFSQILLEIASLGYKPHLSQLTDIEQHNKQENDKALKRIGMAGLGSMQIMMIAVGLYAGGFQGIEQQYQSFMQWISMIVTLPIFIYVGKPFIKSAFRSIKTKQLGMDVPIALAIIIILLQSIVSTLTENGEVYFDSICMFLFFLTLGRTLETRIRHKASELLYQLNKLLPTTAIKVELSGSDIQNKTLLPVKKIKENDILLIEKNQQFPSDGFLLEQNTTVNESMLTGEFMPKTKTVGDFVYAGTKNISQTVLMKATKTGKNTRLVSITHLLSKAQSERPDVIPMANQIARWFVGFVLLAALCVGTAWFFIDKNQVITTMVSVLVISCPCALSLATPITLTVSMSKLSKIGILVLNNRVIEGLNNITHCVFDKTGTLTVGELRLTNIELLSDLNKTQVLSIAGSLEKISDHPIAQTITTVINKQKVSLKPVSHAREELNNGVTGTLNNKVYRLGKISFAQALYQTKKSIKTNTSLTVLLADKSGPLALFHFEDQLRTGAKATINWLKKQNITPILLSGDNSMAVEQVADELAIETYYKDQTPKQKYEVIKALANNKNNVLVIGDGSNDVLAMAGAYLSFSMGAGTDLAKTNSDAVILNNELSLLPDIFRYTKQARKIIKQNITWAITYNLIALPVAATGLVIPYVAVIGMSISSLLVTFNALRLTRQKHYQKLQKQMITAC